MESHRGGEMPRERRTLRIALNYIVIGALGLLIGVLVADTGSRAESAVRVFDAAATDGSYVLVPRLGAFDADRTVGQVFLIDRDGTIVHEWNLPHAVAGHAELQENGDLIYLGVAPEYASGDWESPAPGEAGVLQIVDWDSNVTWTYEDPLIHHDFAVVGDRLAVLRWRQVDDPQKISGGIPREDDSIIWGDEIIEVSRDGSVSEVWNANDGLDESLYPIPDLMSRLEWTHANSIAYAENNPVTGTAAYLISMRQISTVALIERSTAEVVWEYGGFPLLHQQHDPSVTSQGTVLVFDNGQYRSGPSASQAIEIDPLTDEVVWKYVGKGVGGHLFYSSLISGAQRLESGNTLITEGMTGRIFEVDAAGRIVWEFVNPYTALDRFSGVQNPAVFKARAYPADLLNERLKGSKG